MEFEGTKTDFIKGHQDITHENIAYTIAFEDKGITGIIVNKNGPLEGRSAYIEQQPIANDVFIKVDDQAKPHGGYEEYKDYLARQLSGKTLGQKGNVIMQFIIDTNGSVIESKVIRSDNEKLNQIALDAINNSEKWKPAFNKGKAVKQSLLFGITFLISVSDINQCEPLRLSDFGRYGSYRRVKKTVLLTNTF